MAGHTYVTKAYNFNDFPVQEGGYVYGPEQQANWYVVETRRVERVRVPASGYSKWGAPLEMPYDSDYENSSPSRYYERENLMADFLNELQIGASPPMKTSNLSSPNKYRPTSPTKYHPKNLNKYQPTSPKKHYPTSPIKYIPSPNKYESTSPNKYRPTSPNKYLSKSPDAYQSTSPNTYCLISPNKYHPKSLNTHPPTSPYKYSPSSQDKYQATSPTKYRPQSSSYTYPSKEANMIETQKFPGQNKYRLTSPTKYLPTSPTHNYPSKEDHVNRSPHMPVQNKYRSTSPVYKFSSKEGQPTMAQNLSGPNKNHSSSLGVEGGQVADFSSPKKTWQSAGPPTTRHPLTTSTNNINEALSFLMESYSPGGGVSNRPYLRSNTIDSDEAVRRYNGAYVP